MNPGTQPTTNYQRRILCLIIACAAGTSGTIGIAGADEPSTIADVRKAWSKRQKAVRTLTIHWNRKYRAVWRNPPRGGKKPEGAPKDGATFSCTQTAAARFDGERFNLQFRTKDARRYGLLEFDRCAFDGRVSRALMVSSFPRTSAFGLLSSEKHAFGPNKASFVALAACLRPLSPTLARFDFADLRLEPRESGETRIGRHLCLMVTRKVSDAIRKVYYVDPKVDYLIRRIESRVNGRLSIQWDIQYKRDKEHGWLPSAWTMEWWSERGVRESRAANTVTRYEVNKPISGIEFRIDFPPGAKVIDKRKK